MQTSSKRLSAVSRPRRGWFIELALVTLFICVCVGLVLLSPTFQECIQRQQEAAADNHPKEDAASINAVFVEAIGRGGCVIDSIEANDKFVLAVSTVFIALFTLTLWRSTARLWEAGERQMVISNKSWVFAQPWPKTIRFVKDNKIRFVLEFASYGNAPATVTEFFVEFSAIEPKHDLAVYSPNGETVTASFNMAPKNQWWHPRVFETTIDRSYVFGYVKYIDQFGGSRESRFCYKLARGRVKSTSAGSPTYSEFN